MRFGKMRVVFGVVLLAHLLFLAMLAMVSGGGGEVEDHQAEQPLVPVASDPSVGIAEAPLSPKPDESGGERSSSEPAVAGSFALNRAPAAGVDLPASLSQEGLECAILVELPSGKVLWERNADQAVPIASMTKMMTALLAFEAEARREDLSFDTVIPVTKAAYSIGGSQVWLDPRESFTLRELMISIMVKSANDSAYLVAEYLSDGDMDQFVARMNNRAEQLGMSSTRFINAHGLPSGGQSNVASCSDLTLLAEALLHFPRATEWASIPQYTFRADAPKPTELTNHNRLVMSYPGVDGLKTGYTSRAGFCVTATCERDGRRIVAVVTGFGSAKRRNAFVTDLLDWAYDR